ncbi:MAG: beta strand repeat-containing protein [Alphaproteobacteria bacterium]
MAIVTISGSLTALSAEDNEIFTDAEDTAKTYFDTHFSNLTIFEPGSLFVPTTNTATLQEGFDAGSQDTLSFTGTNFLGASGTITHAEFTGVDTGTTILDGSLAWNNATGVTGGTVTSINVTAPDGSSMVAEGTMMLSAAGVLSGNYREVTFTSTTGFIAEFTGNFNVVTHSGKINLLHIHDGMGNGITFTGPFFASAFFATMANEPTIGEVIEFGMSFVDVVTGTGGIDELQGFGSNDRLIGLGGNDTLDGGTGNDSLIGGIGDDIYIVDSATDKVTELTGQGTDTVRSSAASFTLGLNLENLVLTGVANINGIGNAVANTITGNDGNNTLNGGLGNDSLVGGLGDDSFIFNSALDVAVENVGEGSDTVVIAYNNAGAAATINMNDYAEVENATILGTGLFNITGNGLDNTLTGNASVNNLTGAAGDDVLNGGAGADVMDGGADDDTYHIDTLLDTIIDSGGTDTIVYRLTTPTTYTLAADMENLVLFGTAALNGIGNASVNSLTGNAGMNSLNGLAGADVMAGGLGNDIYIVDDAGDTVTEAANQGLDIVRSSASFTLGTNVEALILTGAANIDGTGNLAINTITGNTGDNSLDGMGGLDKLAGGAGNDTYNVYVQALTATTARIDATVTEGINAGTDTIIMNTGGMLPLTNAVTFTLAANVENLDASATGSNKFHLTGNGLANTLTGNNFDNTLNGGAGADVLNGGNGDDTLVVDNAGDATTGGLGTDTVRSSISFDLTADVSSEHLVLTGTAAINGTGHAGDNRITGNGYGNILDGAAGADTLMGLGGADTLLGGLDNDILEGGLGIDTMNGGGGVDTFMYRSAEAGSSTNADIINGFTAGAGGDAIDISDVLVGYAAGSVDAWVHLTVVGGDTVVSVDKNGAAAGGAFYNIATIVGVVGLDADTMVTDGNLIVL